VGLRAKVLDSEKIECIPIDELEVHRDDHADPADGNSRRPKATERPRSALWTEAG
jgi:hypothetical protein